MAGRDERLPPATRTYVIFGVLLVVALALAVREQFAPHRGRGESDSGLRVMVLGGSSDLVVALDEVDGFSVSTIEPAQAVSAGRELLDDEDTPAYAAVLAHADQLGYGFVVLALEAKPALDGAPAEAQAFDWQLDAEDPGIEALPPAGVPYVVFSVGDLAPEGPRARWAELADLDYAASVRASDSVRLALYDHPDFRALWEREGSAHELQARQVLSNRGLPERRVSVLEDQARWRELDALWPAPSVVSNSLAQPWEQVRAAPVHGGVLLEVSPVRVKVNAYRHLELSVLPEAELYFVSRAQLEQPAHPPPRERCEGLPERFAGEIVVAPNGASLALRDLDSKRVEVLTLDPQAAASAHCRIGERHVLTGYSSALGRPNAAGRVAWTLDDFLVWHEPGTSSFSPHVSGLGDYSGPWWVDDQLLAMVAERELGAPDYALDVGIALFDTRRPADAHGIPLDHEWAQVSLPSSELFGPPAEADSAEAEAETERSAPHRTLLDLRPAGPDELYLISESCEDAPVRDGRPCLHRLRAEPSLLSFVTKRAAWTAELEPSSPAPAFELETLGAIGPYLSLSIAADGGRAAWSGISSGDQERRLFRMDLRGDQALDPIRVDDDLLNDDVPRLSADGRILVSSVRVQIGAESDGLGKIDIARVFLLPALPAVPAVPAVPALPALPPVPALPAVPSKAPGSPTP